ncbi:MAG TPA: capsule assembly Wzi family protein, partial [Acidobacteriota bacterium]|nr:capsule assembly Wzi family protein [Acidobacteriota bacterium]
LWNVEVSWRFHSAWEVYGEWMIDDFQIDFVSEPQQIGVMGGLVWWPGVFDGRLMLNAEYQRVNTFVYGQRRPWNRYIHYRDINDEVIGIGSDLGTDADRITVRPRWYLSRNLDLTGLAEYVRRGENRIDTDQAGPLPGGEDFPSGIVERTLTLGLGTHGQAGGHLVVDLMVGYQRIENVEHERDVDCDGPFMQLRFTALWWKTFGN